MKKIDLEILIDQRRVYSHLVFTTISLLALVYSSVTGNLRYSFSQQLGFFLLIFVYQETFIFLAGKLFRNLDTDTKNKKYLQRILSRFLIFYVSCFISALIIYIIFQYFTCWFAGQDLTKVIYNFTHFEFRTWFKSTITGLSIGAVIFVFIQWQDALIRERKLREENLIFLNETLKNQINPHFLFNSLNTLSSLISTRPETAERFIGKMSSIYRYILENSQKNKVPLLYELSFIEDYFDLHKVRDEEKITLTIHAHNGENYEILPVSLQILVENAIKHNIATRENPLHISIIIENERVVVKNNLQKMPVQFKSTQIGLKNLSERAKLITGKELIVEEDCNYFIVKVPLLL
jgi:two-component system LytT family sensor kinase